MGITIRGLMTKVVNKTGLLIDFDVDDNWICPLRGLSEGGSQSVSLSLVLKCCKQRGSADWPIRVLINKNFYGMWLHPRHHILKMTRIVLRYKWRADGSCVPILEGVVENFYDRVFGCCINWEKRTYTEIAEADSTWPINIRGFPDPNIVAPVARDVNNLELRRVAPPSAGGRKRVVIRTFPAKKRRIGRLRSGGGGGGRATHEPDINSGENSNVAGESRKRRYRLLMYNNNRFVLFAIAFTLVACVQLFQGYMYFTEAVDDLEVVRSCVM